MKIRSIAIALTMASTLAGSALAAEKQFVSIGTGGVTGVYYPTGGAICRLVNKGRKEHGIRCSVESTNGSVYNINTVRSGELEFGVAQSDWQYHAYNGTSKFKDKGAFKKLRAVFSVHSEPMTLIVRPDSGIKNVTDLKGKRFNMGEAGSGTQGTWEVIEGVLGWKRSDLKLASQMKSAEVGGALCDNKIDAFHILIGHPSGLVQEAVASCGAKLANVSDPKIDAYIADKPYLSVATIPGGMYPGNPDDIKTFGVSATFVTSSDVSEEAVYQVAKAVMSNLDSFRKLHPAFANLKAENMIKNGLSAPLHRGAIKAYKELGLMK